MVAIKDMEMPKSCKECKDKRIDHITFELCLRTGQNVVDCINHRHCDCPLVEIQERKVGKWVKKYQYGNDYCSECNYENCGYGYPKFCPNCGAKMRGNGNDRKM